MLNIGITEIILIIIVLVVLFFPYKAKDFIRNIGVAIRAFQEGAREVEKELRGGEKKRKR